MNIHNDMSPNKGQGQEPLLHLAPQGLFPAEHVLVLNPSMRTATLLSREAGEGAHIVMQQQFSPNSMRVLIPLLQAYPHYCPYEVLLSSLFQLPLDACRTLLQDAWEVTIRPLRRAIVRISAALRPFGLKICSLRGVGYLLKPL